MKFGALNGDYYAVLACIIYFIHKSYNIRHIYIIILYNLVSAN